MVENKDIMTSVPYIALESAQARHERIVKRLIVALVVVVALLFASNVVWVYEWTRYDYSSDSTVTIDGGERGNANYIGNDGEIRVYGEDNGE